MTDASSDEQNKDWKKKGILWGLGGFFFTISAVGVYFAYKVLGPQLGQCWGWWQVLDLREEFRPHVCMTPNEVGDFLAGTFATLAFIWLLFTVILQAFELSAQRSELALTRGVADQQRIALEVQAGTMAETARLTQEQQARKDLDTLVQLARPEVQKIYGHQENYTTKFSDHQYLIKHTRNIDQLIENIFQNPNHNNLNRREAAIELKWSIERLLAPLQKRLGVFDAALFEQYGFIELEDVFPSIPDSL